MSGYDGYIRINTKIDTKKATSSLLTIQNSMDKTDAKIEELKKRLEELGSEKVPTEAFKELQDELITTEKKLDAARQKMVKFREVHQGKKAEFSTQFKNIQYEIEKLESAYNATASAQAELIRNNQAFISGANTAEYKKVSLQLEEQQKKMQVLNQRYTEYIKKQELAKQKQNEFTASGKKTGGILKTISNRFKGLMLSMLLFNQISKGFNAAVSAVKEGLRSYAGYSSEYNASVSELLGSLVTLKNSMAAAFAPVIQIVVPALNTLVNALIQATNCVAQFLAALSGKNTWTKAVKQVKDYKAGLDGAAKSADKALAPFDELTVLSNDSKSSDSGGGTGSADLFTTEEISNEILASLENGLFGIGQALNAGIIKELENIDWKQIQEKARNIASNIAQFINGFLSDERMSYDIGKTLAELLNTAVDFLLELLGNIDWFKVADNCFAFLKGVFENLDYDDIAVIIGLGLAGMGISHITGKFAGWVTGTLGPELISILTKDLGTVFAEGSFAEIGTTVATGIAAAILAGFLGFKFGEWLNEHNVLGLGDWADSVVEFYAAEIEACGGNIAQGILNGIKKMFSGIGIWICDNILIPFLDAFCELFGIHSPSTVMEEYGVFIALGLLNGIKELPKKVVKVWEDIKAGIKNVISGIKNNVISPGINQIKTIWMNGWTILSNTTKSIFNGIWSTIKKIINSILGGIESMANGVVNGVNKVIDTLNGLSFKIPSWVPVWGGQEWSMNIPTMSTVSLPRLATGGITTGRTIAEIGEAGREAVLPLENNTEWMDRLAEKVNKGGHYTFTAKLNGKTIFEETVKQDELYEDTHGHSAFDR